MSVPAEVLEVYAVDIRYSDDSREPRRDDAVQAFDVAERVRTEARQWLPPDALL